MSAENVKINLDIEKEDGIQIEVTQYKQNTHRLESRIIRHTALISRQTWAYKSGCLPTRYSKLTLSEESLCFQICRF